MSYITVSLLQALPMHNLNRDQNGLPKSQFDGGVQRARLSSQSLKRPARIALRAAISSLPGVSDSVRTKEAAVIVTGLAEKYAADNGLAFEQKSVQARAKKALDSLAAKDNKEADNILFFANAELETLARALVDNDDDAGLINHALDFRSPALDVAAFGRMFANRADLSTQAAVAVSHAVTTHAAKFTIDYFTAVDEHETEREDAGAAHLGLSYYTSGVYYRTFTIDTEQLKRSWSGYDGETARDQIEALVVALIKALPTGRLTNTNAATTPYLVYVEEQRARVSYDFETPVRPDQDGGYRKTSAAALAERVAMAQAFDPGNMVAAAVQGETYGAGFPGQTLSSVHDVATFVADRVFSGVGQGDADR